MDWGRAMILARPPGQFEWTCGDTYESIQMLDGSNVPPRVELELLDTSELPSERRQRLRSEAAGIYAGLPLAVRTAFFGAYVQAERAMDLGQFDLAIALVQAQEAPAGMEEVKAAFVAKLQEAAP